MREALRSEEPDEQTIRIASALTDFPVWKALVDRGLHEEVVTEAVGELLLCSLSRAKKVKETPTSDPASARRRG